MRKTVPRLKKGTAYISILPETTYHASLLDLLRAVRKKNVCFVTLNKPASSLESGFRRGGISLSHIFFVDAVSRGLGRESDSDNVLYLSSPEGLTEMSIAIREVLRTGRFDALIFDSLSTLLMFEQNKSSQRFASTIINSTRSSGALGVFTCLRGDVDTQLIRSSCLVADRSFTVSPHRYASHRAAASTSLAVLVVAGIYLASFDAPALAGAAVAVPVSQYTALAGISFLAAVIPALVLAYIVHKTHLLKPVARRVLKRIRPVQVDQKTFRTNCRKKIYRWLDRAAVHLL